ncbi:MAG TPA: DUF2149 domain-containing protein [Verrucomicrobiales bacterium]|nr:DUF2149 domain-containing protein [Verrucomicrobiales bacterium]
MRRKKRKWDEGSDEDPGAGLLNLFDVWIAFAVALLLAVLSYETIDRGSPRTTATVRKKEGTPDMEAVKTNGLKLERFRASPESLGGDGERLGTAYRLKSGEVIYVPEAPGTKAR